MIIEEEVFWKRLRAFQKNKMIKEDIDMNLIEEILKELNLL
tara:strand:- start:100 stop:222 length:123 start_codon:yes stop_codon:yes gene_type:complete